MLIHIRTDEPYVKPLIQFFSANVPPEIKVLSAFMSRLEVKNLTQTFVQNGSQLPVLDALNFSVDAGEFVALLGSPPAVARVPLFNIISGILAGTPNWGNLPQQRANLWQHRAFRLHATEGSPFTVADGSQERPRWSRNSAGTA